MTANEAREQVKKTDPVTEKRIKTAIDHNPTRTKIWQAPQPRAHNILATPSPEKFLVHHAISPGLRTRHWWASAECEFVVSLSLVKNSKNGLSIVTNRRKLTRKRLLIALFHDRYSVFESRSGIGLSI
jgi:hypothetical protein